MHSRPLLTSLVGSSALAWGLLTTIASADPTSLTGRYSGYEEQAIRDAATDLGTGVEPLPEGKTIERIDFVRLDPIDRHDPLPIAIDALHATSRVSVLRREILVHEGDVWRKAFVDESARNLRLLPQLSLVVCVPMRGSSPDRVRMVVITKDIWSLYVDFDVAATPGGLELLTLEPKESNVAGMQHTALARFVLQPASYALGASYEIPRLTGRWLDVTADANAIVNRATSALEGSHGSVTAQRPLHSSLTKWAWSTGVTWTDSIERRYVNAVVTSFTPDLPATTPVPWMWRERKIVEQAKLTRSFGWETKNDFSVGGSFSHALYRVPADPSLDPRAVAQFARAAVPVGEDRVGPFVQWHGYTSHFLRTLDLETLTLQEDERLGHDLWIRFYPVLRALGSTRDVFGTYAAAAYTIPLGDGLVRGAVESTVEVTPDEVSDAAFRGDLGIITPRIGFGRLVFAATALSRWKNYLNLQSFLGGESLLRGYPSRFFAGKDMFATNLEYRSSPVTIASMHFGLAAFYDVGNAFTGFDHLDPKHAVGFGARAVFPQIDRAVLRFDVGFPVSASPLPPGVPPMSFVLAFHQALALPTVGVTRGP